MYLVTIYNGIDDSKGTVVHSPYPNGVKLSSGSIKKVVQGIPSMSFTINLSNPGWGKIKPLKTLIKVQDIVRNKTVFNGRILKPVQTMTSEGMFSIEYSCEGIMAYLQDSNQRFGEYHNITVRDFFSKIIENHNRQVEYHKRFKVGNVTVTDTNDSLYRYLGYEKTFETIKDKLIDRLGGFLVIREEADGNYIDYLESVGTISDTSIRLRKNLKDMKRDIDPLGVISRLVVLGEKIESDNPNDTGASQARIDIKSVNNGLDYIDEPELIEEFGIVEGTLEFDDISTPSTLKLRGEQFFATQNAAKVTYTITPVDVSLIDNSFESFEIGNWYPIINPVFAIEEPLQIIEQDIDVINPTKTSLTIGEKYKTLTQYQLDANKKIRSVEQLEQTVERQTQTISSLKEEVSTVNNAVTTIQLTLEENDIPALEQAVTDLQDAINNLNTAIDEIPDYQIATPTTEGLMSSTDKAKLDLLQVLTNINIDNLKQKLDLILVTSLIDLDSLEARVEALEGGQPDA